MEVCKEVKKLFDKFALILNPFIIMHLFSYNSKHKIILGIILIALAAYQFTGKRESTRYFENGKPMQTGSFKDGKNHGKWVWFYPNGKKKMEGFFNNGSREGAWITYSTEGKIETESIYMNDKLNGKFIKRNKNGAIITELTYSDDELVQKH